MDEQQKIKEELESRNDAVLEKEAQKKRNQEYRDCLKEEGIDIIEV